jgi:hypothetical protein
MVILDYAKPRSPQPTPAWAVVVAILAPCLLFACYVVVDRCVSWQRSGLLDWIALIAAIAVGLPFAFKATRGWQKGWILIVLYAIVQAIGLFGAGLLIVSTLEKS